MPEQRMHVVCNLPQAADTQSGMDIFSIPQPPYKELAFLDHELELLSRMWGVVAEWETTYGTWKNGHFKELKVCRQQGVLCNVVSTSRLLDVGCHRLASSRKCA